MRERRMNLKRRLSYAKKENFEFAKGSRKQWLT